MLPSPSKLLKKSKSYLVSRAVSEASASTGIPEDCFKREVFKTQSKKLLAHFIAGQGSLYLQVKGGR